MSIPFNLVHDCTERFEEMLKEEFISFEQKEIKDPNYATYWFNFSDLSNTKTAMLLLCIREAGRKEGIKEARKIIQDVYGSN